MTEHVDRRWLHRLTTILLALTAILFFWSTQAAWGRLELGLDRYKVGLLGVDHIFNVGDSGEGHERCGWYDADPVAAHCRPAADGRGAYRLVSLAPVAAGLCEVMLVLAAFAHLRRGSGMSGTGLAPFAVTSALALIAGILLLTRNASHALEIVGDREFQLHGSGLTAAWTTAALLLAVAALSVYSAPQPPSPE